MVCDRHTLALASLCAFASCAAALHITLVMHLSFYAAQDWTKYYARCFTVEQLLKICSPAL